MGSGRRVSGCSIYGVGCVGHRVSGCGNSELGFTGCVAWGLGCRMQGAGCSVQGAGSRVVETNLALEAKRNPGTIDYSHSELLDFCWVAVTIWVRCSRTFFLETSARRSSFRLYTLSMYLY